MGVVQNNPWNNATDKQPSPPHLPILFPSPCVHAHIYDTQYHAGTRDPINKSNIASLVIMIIMIAALIGAGSRKREIGQK